MIINKTKKGGVFGSDPIREGCMENLKRTVDTDDQVMVDKHSEVISVADGATHLDSYSHMQNSVVAALGILIPLAIIADVVHSDATQLSIQLDGINKAKLVNSDGEPIGEELGDGSWALSIDELNDLHVINLSVGQHIITVHSEAQFPNGEVQKNSMDIDLNVIDAANNPLSDFDDEFMGLTNFNENLDNGSSFLTADQNDSQLNFDFTNNFLTDVSGQEVFNWNIADHASSEILVIDIISDFKPEDRVNLSELLDGEHEGQFSNFLHVEYDADNDQTILSISNQGDFDGSESQLVDYASKADHEVVFENVNLVGNASDQSSVIQNLIINQQLVVE